MKLMLDCQDVSRLLSERLDHQLGAPDRARARLHLVMCQSCRNVEEQMAFMRRAMQALGQREPEIRMPGASDPKSPDAGPTDAA